MVGRVEIIRVLADNYSYLFTASDGTTAVVDPGEADPIVELLERSRRRPDQIWLTHKHHDHVGGARALVARYGAKVLAPREAASAAAEATVLADRDEFRIGSERVRVRVISGHTRGHIVYLLDGVIFVGDVLFMGGCGRLFEGTAREMHEGIASVIEPLPDDTLYYCGHEYAERNLKFAQTTEPGNAEIGRQIAKISELLARGEPAMPGRLGDEKRYNPFLRAASPELLAALRERKPDLAATPSHVFAHVRKLRDGF